MKCITTTTHTYYAVVMNVGGIVNNHLYQLNKVKSSTGDVSWRDDFNCVKFSYGDNMKIGLNRIDDKYWIYIDDDKKMTQQFLHGARSACVFLKGLL